MLEQGLMPFVTGFNGATADGRADHARRGGSDFSASILAGPWMRASCGSGPMWIGHLTADPRLVPDCAVLSEVTYREAGGAGLQRGQSCCTANASRRSSRSKSRSGAKNSFRAPEAGDQDRCPRIAAAGRRAGRHPPWPTWR